MNVLSGLEPKNVFHFFEQICAIPHGSYHTKAISDYLVAFAKERGLKYRQDEANNVIIWKGATPGYESDAAGPYGHGLREGSGLRQGHGDGESRPVRGR